MADEKDTPSKEQKTWCKIAAAFRAEVERRLNNIEELSTAEAGDLVTFAEKAAWLDHHAKTFDPQAEREKVHKESWEE